MNIEKRARCHIRMNSHWAFFSAVCMGLSVFVRTVYYFGLINLRDLDGFSLATQVITPMIIAAGYLIMIKGFRINSPILFGGLIGAYALNYFLLMNVNAAGILTGVLLAATAALFVATGLGYFVTRIPVVCCGMVLVLVRMISVDLLSWLLPFSEFRPVAYIPEASNFFGILAVVLMAPALQLSLLPGLKGSSDPAEEELPSEMMDVSAE